MSSVIEMSTANDVNSLLSPSDQAKADYAIRAFVKLMRSIENNTIVNCGSLANLANLTNLADKIQELDRKNMNPTYRMQVMQV